MFNLLARGWAVIVICYCLGSFVFMAVLLYSMAASHGGEAGKQYAENQGYTPEIKKWFSDQRLPGKAPCCSTADGHEVSEEIRDNEYWIRGGFTPEGQVVFPEWTKVDNNLVLTAPNLVGEPVVWWGQGEEGGFVVRCYSPGAKF